MPYRAQARKANEHGSQIRRAFQKLAQTPQQTSAMDEHEPEPAGGKAPDFGWITPGNHGAPVDALSRIGAICDAVGDLFGAMFAVLGTHQAVSHHILAAAMKQCRADLDDLSREDVSALLTSAWNGGRCGFDAVMRSRRKGLRKTSTLPWAQE